MNNMHKDLPNTVIFNKELNSALASNCGKGVVIEQEDICWEIHTEQSLE